MTTNPNSAAQSIYARLEAAILSGRLKPRQRLVERTLEKEFDVSRTPVREALRQLQYAGMVRTTTGRGVVVCDIDAAEVFNLYAVRLPLEKLAIELTPPITQQDGERLSALLDLLEEAYGAHDFPRMVVLNSQFHRSMAELTGNSSLVATLEQIRRHCYLVVQHGPVAERTGLATSLADHHRMLELLVARDLAALTRLTFEHILRSALFYLRRGAITDPGAEVREAALKDIAEQLLRMPAIELRITPPPRVPSEPFSSLDLVVGREGGPAGTSGAARPAP